MKKRPVFPIACALIAVVVGAVIYSVLREQASQRRAVTDETRTELKYVGLIVNASPSEKDFKTNLEFARRLRSEAIFPIDDIKCAMTTAATVAAVEPSDEDRELLIRLASNRDIRGKDIGEFALNIWKVRNTFRDKAETFSGTAKQFVVAGKGSRGILTPLSISRLAVETAESAKDNGRSPAEMLATIVVLAKTGRLEGFGPGQSDPQGDK